MAQISLTRLNTGREIIEDIYGNLAIAGVNSLHLMKFFLVGRGANRIDLSLETREYKKAIEVYRELEQPTGPKVYIQTALRNGSKGINSSHLNITSQGLLLSDPWAYDNCGKPIKEFILGDLKYQRFSEIVKL